MINPDVQSEQPVSLSCSLVAQLLCLCAVQRSDVAFLRSRGVVRVSLETEEGAARPL